MVLCTSLSICEADARDEAREQENQRLKDWQVQLQFFLFFDKFDSFLPRFPHLVPVGIVTLKKPPLQPETRNIFRVLLIYFQIDTETRKIFRVLLVYFQIDTFRLNETDYTYLRS